VSQQGDMSAWQNQIYSVFQEEEEEEKREKDPLAAP
jgi:hypothetical protein